jgi:fatty acid desaturase
MDHTALIKSLPPEVKARLNARSDIAGLRHLALYLLALMLTSAGIFAQIPLWPLLMIPQGILLVFLFTLSHECTHQTPFASPWLNEACGHAIAPLLGLPFIWFRYFHLAHHKHTNDPAHDPEIAAQPRPQTRSDWLLYLSGLPYWRGMARTLWANARGHISAPYLPARRHKAMRVEARIILGLYALGALSLLWSPLILWLWLIPVLIAQPALRAYLLAEHGLCPPVADMFENSRTTYTSRVIRALAWNMPYHAEHHSLPQVPFHQLPALHRLTRAHLKSTSQGYGEFSAAYLRSLDHQER